MKLTHTSAATLAAAAATLFLAGAVPAFAADAAADAKGHCVGGNACKGQGACKTAKNECKGQNGCKGTSFTEATAADCAKIKDAKFEAPGAEKK